MPHLLANYILSASDRIIITNTCGSEYNAIYSVACSCMSIGVIAMTSINNAIAPWVFDKLKQNDYSSIKAITTPYLIVFLVPIMVFMLVAPEFIFIMGDSGYSEGVYAVAPLMVSVFFNYAYCLYVNLEQYSGKTWAIALGTVIAASINVGLNFIFIPMYGYIVAAYTTLIGYILLFAVHFVFVR